MPFDPLKLPEPANFTINDPRWYPVIIEDVTDGDTIVVTIDRGHDQISRRQSIRLRRIDTAESDGTDPALNKLGQLAKRVIASLLPIGSTQYLMTYRTPKAKREEVEKFGRFQGDIPIRSLNLGVETLVQYLVAHRLAVPYYGQSKTKTLEGHSANYLYHADRGSFSILATPNP